jgi:hypothetical protein
MINLGLRLSFNGGREALLRLAAIASGVAIGVAMLLFMISGLQLLNGTLDRACWQCTGQITPTTNDGHTYTNVDPLHWHRDRTIFDTKRISWYDIAETGPRSPQIPGIAHLPKPGEYYVSPALAELMAKTPDDQLDNRFPGKLAGQITREGLDGPKDLIVVVGRTPAVMPLTDIGENGLPSGSNGFTYQVWRVEDQPQKRSYGPFITALFLVGVAGLLFSVIALISTTTRLSASRREEKFAALRLFGATPRQINLLAAIDAALGAGLGALLGIGLFYLLRSTLTAGLSSIEIASFFPEDLAPGVAGILIVLIGVPLLAAGAAVISLRRVRISPLGVARKTTPKPPLIWELLPLVAGLAIMAGVWFKNRNITDTAARGDLMPYFLGGFLLLLLGIVMAGPWLTMTITRLLAKRTRSASGLLAFRRIADNPRSTFRPVSTLVIAAFLCTAMAALTPLLLDTASNGLTADTSKKPIILDEYFTQYEMGIDAATLQPILNDLKHIPHVQPVLGYNRPCCTTRQNARR